MDGFFIRRGDKTSCGGVVTGSDSLITMMGIQHAREGDSVTCGVTGLTYRIQGGVSYISSSGIPVAGTLDSVSGCPCKASLYHSWTNSTYVKQVPRSTAMPALARTSTLTTPGQPGNASSSATWAALDPVATTPEFEGCSGCFQLVNQRYMPCGLHTYLLLLDGERIGENHLNEQGFSNIGTSPNPISAQVATSAPSPVLE
ncbi:PAAR domain-containing protein [Pseudomonas japonica]|uniref:PAAR domain-containing protein n=1 Tax=Pseudomonas japonica TaxID=256466 RepID=UPI00380DCDF7